MSDTKYYLGYFTRDEVALTKYPEIIDDSRGWKSLQPVEWIDGKFVALEAEHGLASFRIGVSHSSHVDFNKEGNKIRLVYRGRSPELNGCEIQSTEKEDFKPISVFTTARLVMSLFENEVAVGRPILWAFYATPLTLEINEVDYENGPVYSRGSQSIKLVWMKNEPGEPEFEQDTALLPDVIAHEVAHAVLDGLAPDLLTSTFQDSKAIHEAIADLSAFFLTTEIRDQWAAILGHDDVDYDLRRAYVAADIAEGVGRADGIKNGIEQHYLRSLLNSKTIQELDINTNAHDQSEVLSGMLYDVVCDEVAIKRKQLLLEGNGSIAQSKFTSILFSIWKVKNTIYRALDCLPPGDITFEDLIKTLTLTNSLYYPRYENNSIRNFILENAVKRGILPHCANTFTERTPVCLFDDITEDDFNGETLRNGYYETPSHKESFNRKLSRLVYKNRVELGLTNFEEDQLVVTGAGTFSNRFIEEIEGEKIYVREALIKVMWDATKTLKDGRIVVYRQGKTIIIDTQTMSIRCAITSMGPTERTRFTSDSSGEARCLSIRDEFH